MDRVVFRHALSPLACSCVFGLALFMTPATAGTQAAPEAPTAPKPATPEFVGPPRVIEAASKEETAPVDTPDAISTVSREETLRRVPEDLGHAVDMEAGVYTQRTAAGQASPFIRGLTGKQVLLTIDGIRYNNSAFRSGPNQYFSSIDPMLVERIEIVRGPSSVLYGSDALGGVINVITRRPPSDGYGFHPGARGDFASANRGRRITGDLPFAFEGMSMSGYASASAGGYRDLVGGPNIGEQPFTNWTDWSGTGGFRYDLAPGWRLDWRLNQRVQNDVYRTDRVTTIVANPALLPRDADGNRISVEDHNIFPNQEDTFTYINLRHERDAGPLRSLDFDISYHRVFERLNRVTRSTNPSQREMFFRVDTWGATGTATLDFGPMSHIVTGFDLARDTIASGRRNRRLIDNVLTDDTDDAQFPDGSTYLIGGLYVQDEITLADGLFELRPGVRVSHFKADADTSIFGGGMKDVDSSITDVTGAIALTWRPERWSATTLSVSRGFRAPNLDDVAASKGAGRGEEIPNPDLDPEELWAFQIIQKFEAANHVATSAAPYRVAAQIAWYDNLFNDMVVSTNTTFAGEDVVQLANTGRARIFGWEADVRYYFGEELEKVGLPRDHILTPGDALAVWANAAFNHGDDLSAKMPLSRMMPLRVNGGLNYSLAGGTVFIEPSIEIWDKQDRYSPSNDGDVRFAQPHTPGFTLVHLGMGWKPGKQATLRLAARNITNKDYQVIGSGVFGSGTDLRLSLEIRW